MKKTPDPTGIVVLERYVQIYTDQSTHLHHLPGTESLPAGVGDPPLGACENRGGAKIRRIPEDLRPTSGWRAQRGFSWCKVGCKEV